jgi:hypothetical protein
MEGPAAADAAPEDQVSCVERSTTRVGRGRGEDEGVVGQVATPILVVVDVWEGRR